MALVRICDKCSKIVEDSDYINIEYVKRLSGNLMGSRIIKTLCEQCFEEEFGEGHLNDMVQQYQMERHTTQGE